MGSPNRTVNRWVIIESATWLALVLLWGGAALFRQEEWISLVLRLVFVALLFRLSFWLPAATWTAYASAVVLLLLATFSALTGDQWIINATVILSAAIILRYVWELVNYKVFTKVLEPYQRLVVSRMGGEYVVKGPGRVVVRPFLPFREKWIWIDMREGPIPFPVEIPICFTQDQYQLKLDVEIFWRVTEPSWRVTQVTDIQESLTRIIPGAVLETVGKMKLEELLSQQDQFGQELVANISGRISPWGVCVTRILLKQILPTQEVREKLDLARAAEQERIANQIRADGESYAIEKVAKAKADALRAQCDVAKEMDQNSLYLKFFESLEKLGEGQSTKYILPMEFMDFLKSFSFARKPPAT